MDLQKNLELLDDELDPQNQVEEEYRHSKDEVNNSRIYSFQFARSFIHLFIDLNSSFLFILTESHIFFSFPFFSASLSFPLGSERLGLFEP